MKRLFGVLAGALLVLAVPVLAHAQGDTKGSEKKAMSASGTVKSVSASSLTITTKTGDDTFSVDAETKVTATGASHKSEAMKGEKKATQITDFVHEGDKVTVSYHDMGGTKHAANVRVTQKAPAAPKK